MNMLARYENLRAALAEASTLREVLTIRDDIDHLKLHAKKVKDRALLTEATVFQLRAERVVGRMLWDAKEAGQIAEGRRSREELAADSPRVTLPEIGVDRNLSARAQRAAALDDDAFEAIVTTTRQKMAAGKAIIVDPVASAAKDAELAGRRAAHQARTQNGGCVADLHALAASGRKFKSIAMDPQWKFLTRSEAGDGRSANVHYKTEAVDAIKALPIEAIADDDCALYMWMVDWCPQDALDLIAHYGFKHITTAFTWIKTNGDDAELSIWSESTWHMGQGYWTRANPEACYFATRGNPKRLYADVRQTIVAPVMEHSRKPDAWLERIERLTEGDYIELQARRPRKGWVSWGDELEWTGRAA